MNRRRPTTRRRWLNRLALLAGAAALAIGGAGTWRTTRHAPGETANAPTPAAPAAVLVRPLDWTPHIAPLAGDGLVGWRDGPVAQARFADPYGVAVGSDGTVFVADAGDTNRIRTIRDGVVATLAGGREGFHDGVGAQAQFNTPSGIALDAQGDVIVADTGNHAIRKVAADGRVTTLAGTGHPGFRDGPGAQAQFDAPLAVAVDKSGRVIVADAFNDRVRAIAPDGTVTTLAGGSGADDLDGPAATARFDTPAAVAVDPRDGHIVVADLRNHALRAIDAAGNVTTLARAPDDVRHAALRRPVALAIANDGTLAVGTMGGGVLRLSTAGDVRVLVDAEPRLFARPTGLAIASGERLVVTDAVSSRLHVLTPRTDAATATTPLVDGATGPSPQRPLPATAGRWPVRPQLAWHEVVGVIGEDRGAGARNPRDHFHGGLDVRGDVGQAVVAIADAKVDNPSATFAFGELGEGLALGDLDYIHMRVGRDARGAALDPARFVLLDDAAGKPARVRVRRGTRFAAGEVLGTINPMAHVHLAFDDGTTGNPLALGFTDFRDHVPPTIASIEVRNADGQRFGQKVAGRLLLPRADLQLVVDAYDQVDDNLPRRRLGVYSLGYQWLHTEGTPLAGFEQPRESVRFDGLPDDADIMKAYADGSGISVQGQAETHFRYLVSSAPRQGPVAYGPWSTAAIPPGDYTLRIVAKDWSGNEATRGRDVAVSIVDGAVVATTPATAASAARRARDAKRAADAGHAAHPAAGRRAGHR